MRPQIGSRQAALRARDFILLFVIGILCIFIVAQQVRTVPRCPATTATAQRPCPPATAPECPACPSGADPRLDAVAVAAPPQHAATAPYTLRIVVFTYNRIAGLRRLLRSLIEAKYPDVDPATTQLSLSIYMDYRKSDTVRLDGTREYLNDFVWPYGPLHLHRREVNVGLKRNILEAWYPVGNGKPLTELKEFSIFLEDDIEVSPYWFIWADKAIRTYSPAFAPNTDNSQLLGVSLFRPIQDELSGKMAPIDAERGGDPFLLAQPCSWGAVYFPHLWQPFREWYHDLPKHFNPAVRDPRDPQVRPSSNTWASTSSWKMFLIHRMYWKGWFMLYPNLPERTVLSTNHLMEGEHPTPKREWFELPLFPPASLSSTPTDALLKLPPLGELEAFDVMFRPKGKGPGGIGSEHDH